MEFETLKAWVGTQPNATVSVDISKDGGEECKNHTYCIFTLRDGSLYSEIRNAFPDRDTTQFSFNGDEVLEWSPRVQWLKSKYKEKKEKEITELVSWVKSKEYGYAVVFSKKWQISCTYIVTKGELYYAIGSMVVDEKFSPLIAYSEEYLLLKEQKDYEYWEAQDWADAEKLRRFMASKKIQLYK